MKLKLLSILLISASVLASGRVLADAVPLKREAKPAAPATTTLTAPTVPKKQAAAAAPATTTPTTATAPKKQATAAPASVAK